MRKLKIVNLAKPTPGDKEFYTRWLKCGELTQAIKDADILIVDHNVDIDNKFISENKNIKVIVSPTTGHTHLKYDLKKIPTLSLRGEKSFLKEVSSVSEFTFHLILKLMREFKPIGSLLRGKTLGIIGYGRIGRHVEEKALGFGMKVLKYDPHESKAESDLDYLLKFSHIVTVHASETEETKNLISAPELTIMNGAYLINTARSSIVNSDDLIWALENEVIKGAACDFAEDAKLLEASERLDNLIVTAHQAGRTLEDRIKTDEFMSKKLFKYLDHYQIQLLGN